LTCCGADPPVRGRRPRRPSCFFAAALLLAAADFKGLLEQGQIHYSRGEWEPAQQALSNATKLSPKSFEARFLLGATLVQLNRSVDAIRELRIACRLNPKHRDAAKLLAIEYGKNDNTPETIKLLAPMVDEKPFDEEIHLLLIEAYEATGDADHALKLATKTMERFPESAAANYWMGLQLRDAGRFAEAKPFLEKALRLYPDYQLAYVASGDLALKQEQYEEAARYFRMALSKKADDAEAHIGLSRALVALNQLSSAIETLERAVELTPDPRIHLELSRLYLRTGDRARAAKEAELFRQKK
jgi:tetratricopeptide (TPR) repeat protein